LRALPGGAGGHVIRFHKSYKISLNILIWPMNLRNTEILRHQIFLTTMLIKRNCPIKIDWLPKPSFFASVSIVIKVFSSIAQQNFSFSEMSKLRIDDVFCSLILRRRSKQRRQIKGRFCLFLSAKCNCACTHNLV